MRDDQNEADTWYVAYTRPRQERMAEAHLREQGFDSYLPLFKMTRKRPVQRAFPVDSVTGPVYEYEPMFPRYCFFRPARAGQSIAAARSTRGVNSLVQFGARLAVVQPDVVACIRERESQRDQAALSVVSRFQPGRQVRFLDPALCELEGLVQSVSSRRVMLLLEILGRTTMVKVSHDQVALA